MTFDASYEGKLLARTVSLSGQIYGTSYVVEIMQGIPSERVLANNHERLPTFGQGKHLQRKQWQSIARQMVAAGYLNLTKLGSLEHGPKAFTILKGGTPLFLSPMGRQKPVTPPRRIGAGLPEHLRQLLEGLVAERKRLADQSGHHITAVASNRSLEDMLAKQPSSIQEMADIKGFTKEQFESFGEAFLEILEDNKKARQIPDEADVLSINLFA